MGINSTSSSQTLKFIQQILHKGRGISRAVMLEHTLFSMPFAVSAFLLESAGSPSIARVVWIILAVFGARNAANALNRLIDEQIDKENPRTADRDLPAGRVTHIELILFTSFCLILFLVSAWMLNLLCFALTPVAGVLIFGYSYSKRFTWLCHYWLGIACSAAVMGSFLALSGRFELRYFPLTAAVMFWVAGFDILYALQDIEHDKTHGIFSVPARFGEQGARIISAASHALTVFCLASAAWFFPVRQWYAAGVVGVAIIIIAEHIIAARYRIEKKQILIHAAAYKLNQILSPVFLSFTVLDVYLPGGMYGN